LLPTGLSAHRGTIGSGRIVSKPHLAILSLEPDICPDRTETAAPHASGVGETLHTLGDRRRWQHSLAHWMTASRNAWWSHYAGLGRIDCIQQSRAGNTEERGICYILRYGSLFRFTESPSKLLRKLEHRMGVEPMNTGFADQRVSHFATGALVRRATRVACGG
jgi:hypothetical protein